MQGLHRMVALLEAAPLRAAILEGLVASIGGLDGSLSKAATAQLVRWLSAGELDIVNQLVLATCKLRQRHSAVTQP